MSLEPVLHHVRRLAGASAKPLCDRALLRAFARRRDEAAFAELVRRHGPLVRGVARRVLGDADAADDVFQAAFLVLARKAAALRWRRYVGSWLSATAYRMACKARTAAARRRRHEAAAARERPAATAPAWAELQAVLDEELHRLPERYRAPLLLCYYEGLTRDEAARRLGWSFGTLCRRLTQGRDALRRRLERRGAALGAGLLAVGAPEVMRAAVPAALERATVTAAVMFAAGGTVSGQAALLAAELSSSAGVTKEKVLAVAVLLASTLAVTVGSRPGETTDPQPPAPGPAGRPAPAPVAFYSRDDEPLPEGVIASLGSTRWRHGEGYNALAFSKDGRMLVSSGTPHALCLWDAATGRALWRGLDPDAPIQTIAFSSDGRRLATGNSAGVVRIWAVQQGQLRELWAVRGRNSAVTITADDRAVIAGGYDKAVRILDITDGREIGQFASAPSEILCLSLSSNSRTLAGACTSRLVIWDVASRELRQTIPVGRKEGQRVALSPNGSTVAAGGDAGLVRIWEVATGRLLLTLGRGSDDELRRRRAEEEKMAKSMATHQGVLGSISALTFAPDGRTLYVGSGDRKSVYRFEVATGRELLPLSGASNRSFCLAVSPDGRRLAAAGDRCRIALWDTAEARLLNPEVGHAGRIFSHAYSADGRKLVTGGEDLTIRLWDLAGRKELALFEGPKAYPMFVAISPDGRSVAAEAGFDPVFVWDVATGARNHQLSNDIGVWYNKDRLTLSPDGKLRAINGTTVQLVEVATGRVVRQFEGPTRGGPHSALAFAPEGRSLAASCSLPGDSDKGNHPRPRGEVRVWEIASGQLRWAVQPPAGQAVALAFAPHGRALAFSYWVDYWTPGEGIRVYEPSSGRELRAFNGHHSVIGTLAFAPGGQTLASSSEDGLVLSWDVAGLSRPRTLALSPEQLEAAWAELTADATRAGVAIDRFADAPAAAVPFLRQRLRPAAAVDAARLDKLLADLAGPRFADREATRVALAALDTQAEPALRRFLAAAPTAEAKQRAEQLLARLDGPLTGPDRLREVRAVEALERMATPAAAELLQALAGGAPDARLTGEARAARDRLSRRPEADR
jgi:RNA polymerase sigma factor (sigma-70 family)